MFLNVMIIALNGRDGELIKFKDILPLGLINVKAILILILIRNLPIFKNYMFMPTHILIPGLNGNSSL